MLFSKGASRLADFGLESLTILLSSFRKLDLDSLSSDVCVLYADFDEVLLSIGESLVADIGRPTIGSVSKLFEPILEQKKLNKFSNFLL